MGTADESVAFACPLCARVTRVPSSFIGKQGRCPGCRATIEVPDPNAPVEAPIPALEPVTGALALDAPPVVDPGAAPTEVAQAAAGGEGAPPALASDDDHRPCVGCGAQIRSAAIKCRFCGHVDDCPCRFCGERIKATAKKCRFCGEFLDDRLRSTRRQLSDDFRLAAPMTRLAGYLVDEWVLCLPYMLLLGLALYLSAESRQKELSAVAAIAGVTWWVALTAIQWYRLSSRGQTIAKGWFGIKVVGIDGSPAGFVHAVILRNWIFGVIASPILSWIAALFRIVDGLLIFAEDRRSLRDYLASTRVVEVDPPPPPT